MRVLIVTSEWPSATHPERAPFLVRQVDALRRIGLDVDVFSFEGRRSPLNYFRIWRRLRTRARAGSYDVVHAHWGHSAFLAWPQVAPLVVTFHGSDLEGIIGADGRYSAGGRVLRVISKGMARAANQVILVSSSLARHLPGVSHQVIPCGVDLNLFRPADQTEARRELGLAATGRYVLFAASPERPEKRFALAKDAVQQLNRSHDAELIVASRVPPRAMPVYMNACDLLLLTSSHEGSPTVIKEALACNLPIVALDVGDVRSRIADVEGCEVCTDQTPSAIASAMGKVLQRNRRVEGRASVMELGDDLLAGRIADLYRQVIAAAT